MNELTTYSNYRDFKQALDNEMYGAVESFVKIGYLLQYAEETNIVHEGGYDNVNQFAKSEYGIEASQVSRFINIHKRFGVHGEARLQDRYANHGVAKLGIMLTLPDYINEEISSDYSKSEINALKTEIESEQKISELEVMMEEKDLVIQSLPEGLKQAVHQLIHDYPQEYVRMYDAVTMDDFKEALAPNGEASYTFRISGTGKFILFVRVTGDIGVINVRSGDNEHFDWKELWDCAKEYFCMGGTGKESWSNVFNEPFPEVEKVQEINGQQSSSQPAQKKEHRKESRVKTPAPKPQPKPDDKEPVKEPEEQLPGQDNIMNHPELLPDSMKENKTEVIKGEVEDIEPDPSNADKTNVQQDSSEIAPVQLTAADRHVIAGYKSGVKAAAHVIATLADKEEWETIIKKAEDIVWRAKKIIEMEGAEQAPRLTT